MTHAAAQLDSKTIDRVLQLLHDFVSGDPACVQAANCPGEAGRCNFDAAHFQKRFVDFLNERNQPPARLLGKLEHILQLYEIARNGGVKAMLYRLETGCRNLPPDYTCGISQRLRNGLALHGAPGPAAEGAASTGSLLDLLRATPLQDAEMVMHEVARIDSILLEIGRRLDGDLQSQPVSKQG